MKVRLTLRALNDLEEITAFIESRNPVAATHVRNELQAAFGLLASHPLAGRALVGRRRRLALRRFPYLIFYRINSEAGIVEITTIRHGARAQDQA